VPVLHIFLVLFTVNTHVPLKIAEEGDMVHKGVFKGGGWGSAAPGSVKFMDSRGFSAPNGCHGQIPDYVPEALSFM